MLMHEGTKIPANHWSDRTLDWCLSKYPNNCINEISTFQKYIYFTSIYVALNFEHCLGHDHSFAEGMSTSQLL